MTTEITITHDKKRGGHLFVLPSHIDETLWSILKKIHEETIREAINRLTMTGKPQVIYLFATSKTKQ